MTRHEHEMFDRHGLVTAHARLSDPVSSEYTVASIGRDTSLRRLVMNAVIECYEPGGCVTDDVVLTHIELRQQRRFQRNVLARTRGLLENEGWLARHGFHIRNDGRRVITFIPTHQALDAYHKETSCSTTTCP